MPTLKILLSYSDTLGMDIQTLDELTKWMAFSYGVLLFFVLEFPPHESGGKKIPGTFSHFETSPIPRPFLHVV